MNHLKRFPNKPFFLIAISKEPWQLLSNIEIPSNFQIVTNHYRRRKTKFEALVIFEKNPWFQFDLSKQSVSFKSPITSKFSYCFPQPYLEVNMSIDFLEISRDFSLQCPLFYVPISDGFIFSVNPFLIEPFGKPEPLFCNYLRTDGISILSEYLIPCSIPDIAKSIKDTLSSLSTNNNLFCIAEKNFYLPELMEKCNVTQCKCLQNLDELPEKLSIKNIIVLTFRNGEEKYLRFYDFFVHVWPATVIAPFLLPPSISTDIFNILNSKR